MSRSRDHSACRRVPLGTTQRQIVPFNKGLERGYVRWARGCQPNIYRLLRLNSRQEALRACELCRPEPDLPDVRRRNRKIPDWPIASGQSRVCEKVAPVH